jgi:hypothetical protein
MSDADDLIEKFIKSKLKPTIDPDRGDLILKVMAMVDHEFHELLGKLITTMRENGMTHHEVDTVVLNAMTVLLAKTMTKIAVMLKRPLDIQEEVVQKTCDDIKDETFEHVTKTISKHSGGVPIMFVEIEKKVPG